MVTALDYLIRLRLAWMQLAGETLAEGQNLRETASKELSHFYDLLSESVATGDSAPMQNFLNGWVKSQVSFDVAAVGDEPLPSVVPVLHVLRRVTFEVAEKNLEPHETIGLIEQADPIFSSSIEFVAREEVIAGMSYVAVQMKDVQNALEQLDKSKSNFIAVAAHELKTPLTLIEGYAKMLEELVIGNSEARGGDMINGIADGTRRLKEIIDDMIDVSMIDNNMLSLHFQPVWLNQLLALADNELSETVMARGLALRIMDFEGGQDMTYADPERLLQAIMNVLRNAVKYTPDGGSITVDGRKLPGFVEMRVSDTGIGIAAEDQSRIFEKFGRVGNPSLHSSGKTKFMGGGPGLGLPIAKGILEAHGGAIWVESDGYDGEMYPGSTFHLMIPMREAPPEDKSSLLLGSMQTKLD